MKKIFSNNNLCNLCPRNCSADRSESQGFCKSPNLKIARAAPHFYEEPLISGAKGSGAIFFSGCNLKCVYCQNYKISDGNKGEIISVKKLSQIIEELDKNCDNINFVTPTHFTSEIIRALDIYKPENPVIWNTSGYEKPDTVVSLKNYVDVFLCDIKYFDANISLKYSKAADYFDFCSKSVLQMRKNLPTDIIENGLIKKGLILRHLVLPGCTSDSIKILEWIKENLGEKTIVSIMSQFYPCFKCDSFPELNRKISNLEYKRVINKCLALNLTNGFMQELSSADSVFTPDF